MKHGHFHSLQNDQNLDLQHFEEVCRAHGLKITHQRLEIYRALAGSRQHPSAEMLHNQLIESMPTLSLDTVYRTLATFEELGLARRLETIGSQARFEARMDQHHHFFCQRCGEVSDFAWPGFDAIGLPEELAGLGKVSRKNVVLHGVCSRCMKDQRESVA